MKAPSTHTGQATGQASGVAVRALAVPEPRTLEDLDDGDIQALATFLLVPPSPWPFFAFLAVVTSLRVLIDHPLLTWMNTMLLALPGYVLTGWRLAVATTHSCVTNCALIHATPAPCTFLPCAKRKRASG